MKNGQVICEPKFEFDFEFNEEAKPEFLSKYYKTYRETGEAYYTDVIEEN